MQIIPEMRRAKFDVYVFYTPKVIDPLEYPYLHLPVSQFSANNLCFFLMIVQNSLNLFCMKRYRDKDLQINV
jgi:hypothetical protein